MDLNFETSEEAVNYIVSSKDIDWGKVEISEYLPINLWYNVEPYGSRYWTAEHITPWPDVIYDVWHAYIPVSDTASFDLTFHKLGKRECGDFEDRFKLILRTTDKYISLCQRGKKLPDELTVGNAVCAPLWEKLKIAIHKYKYEKEKKEAIKKATKDLSYYGLKIISGDELYDLKSKVEEYDKLKTEYDYMNKEHDEKIEKLFHEIKTINDLYAAVDKALKELKENVSKLQEANKKPAKKIGAGSTDKPKNTVSPGAELHASYNKLDRQLIDKVSNYLRTHKKPTVRMLTKSCMKGYLAVDAIRTLDRLGFSMHYDGPSAPSTCIVDGRTK